MAKWVINPESEFISIVLIGQFNPAIFQPAWFASHGILGEKETEAAEVEIIHSAVSKFKLDWLRIQVERERFICEVLSSPLDRAYDITVKTFKENLIHTPIFQMGINLSITYQVAEREHLDRIGDALAPKNPWGAWGKVLLDDSGKRSGGLKSMTMEQSERDDGHKGFIRVKIEPSRDFKSGIDAQVNDHFEAADIKNVNGADEILSILESSYSTSQSRAKDIINDIMRL
ncbi:MAG: hypothetical protein HOB18_10100 [Nitrospina sp.]|jgi:hypothetical protein|nr:hypothetical protein [Nitrospina sp.]